MMMQLALSKQALKTLAALDPKQFKQVASAIFKLLSQPLPHDIIAMKGSMHGERRLDVGAYRGV